MSTQQQEFYVYLNNLKALRSNGYFVETLKLIADTYADCSRTTTLHVALAKIAFVNTMSNINSDIFFTYVTAAPAQAEKTVTIPTGNYKNIEQLVNALNNAIPDEARANINFRLNTLTKEVTVVCIKGAIVQLSKALRQLLKIRVEIIENTITSLSYPDINYRNHLLKLRTNLVYSTLTNSSGAETLLSSIPICAEFGELCVYEPLHLEYHEVKFEELHLIELELVDIDNLPAEIDAIEMLQLCFKLTLH